MIRPSVEIKGQVFEPQKLGVLGRVIAEISLGIYAEKIGWGISDPLEFKAAVAGMRLQSFYGKQAADAFDDATREQLWKWQCTGVESTRRKVLVLNP